MIGHGTSWGVFNFPAGNRRNLVPKIQWRKNMPRVDDTLMDYLSLLSCLSPSLSPSHYFSPSEYNLSLHLSSRSLCLSFSGWMAPACRDFGFRGPCDRRDPAVWSAATSGQPHHLAQQSNFWSVFLLSQSLWSQLSRLTSINRFCSGVWNQNALITENNVLSCIVFLHL